MVAKNLNAYDYACHSVCVSEGVGVGKGKHICAYVYVLGCGRRIVISITQEYFFFKLYTI